MTIKRSGPLPRRSPKRQAFYETVRIPLVKQILEDRPNCELRTPVCTTEATCVHELQSRARAGSKLTGPGSLSDPEHLRSACWPCNVWVEDNPAEAIACGLARHSWWKEHQCSPNSSPGCDGDEQGHTYEDAAAICVVMMDEYGGRWFPRPHFDHWHPQSSESGAGSSMARGRPAHGQMFRSYSEEGS